MSWKPSMFNSWVWGSLWLHRGCRNQLQLDKKWLHLNWNIVFLKDRFCGRQDCKQRCCEKTSEVGKFLKRGAFDQFFSALLKKTQVSSNKMHQAKACYLSMVFAGERAFERMKEHRRLAVALALTSDGGSFVLQMPYAKGKNWLLRGRSQIFYQKKEKIIYQTK